MILPMHVYPITQILILIRRCTINNLIYSIMKLLVYGLQTEIDNNNESFGKHAE